MATFVEKYVRRPIADVDQYASDLLDLCIRKVSDTSGFSIDLFKEGIVHYEWRIARHEDAALIIESDDSDSIGD